jgi:hypothetical protein
VLDAETQIVRVEFIGVGCAIDKQLLFVKLNTKPRVASFTIAVLFVFTNVNPSTVVGTTPVELFTRNNQGLTGTTTGTTTGTANDNCLHML